MPAANRTLILALMGFLTPASLVSFITSTPYVLLLLHVYPSVNLPTELLTIFYVVRIIFLLVTFLLTAVMVAVELVKLL